MDYSKFGVEDFLCDDSFLGYCLESNAEAVRFWTEWLNKNPEKVALANTARLLFYTLNGNISADTFHQDHQAFKNALALKMQEENLLQSKADSTQTHQSDLSRVAPAHSLDIRLEPASDQAQPDSSLPGKTTYVRRLWIGTASLAACILLAVGFFMFRPRQSKIPAHTQTLAYAARMGTKKTIKLPDGSILTLNGGSHVQLHKDFNHINRELTLTGEGYFVVVHNSAKPFIVHTEKITIKDVGTEFNVKAYPNDKITEASLIKGLVEITIKGNTKTTAKSTPIILSPNKKFIFVNEARVTHKQEGVIKPTYKVKDIVPTEDNSVAETDWTQNKLTFVDEPLSEMAPQMERWYGVKVVIANPALNNLHFTATFDHGDIIQVLEALKLSGNFNYRKEDNMIRIY